MNEGSSFERGMAALRDITQAINATLAQQEVLGTRPWSRMSAAGIGSSPQGELPVIGNLSEITPWAITP
jgi:hypothetical protein